MAIKPQGLFSKTVVDSIEAAEALQGMAVAYISESYAAVRDEELTMENLTWEKLINELTSADDNGTFDQLNEQLIRNIIGPVIEQALAQPEEGAQ